MIATSVADLISGLILGLFLGLLIGPVLRSWLRWQEWSRASAEADLFADVLDRMAADPSAVDDVEIGVPPSRSGPVPRTAARG